MTDKNDFYEDDESIEKIEAEWGRGEEVVTVRSGRDLNQRAAGIVGQVIERSETAVEVEEVEASVSFVSDKQLARLEGETSSSPVSVPA